MAHNLAYWAELVARLSTVSLSVVVLGITGYCSAEFGEDFMATYVVMSIILIYAVAMSIRAIIMLRLPKESRNTLHGELCCYGALDWIMAAACTPSIIFMAMADYGGHRYIHDEETGRSYYEPYVADPWRNYAIFIQCAILALEFMLGIGSCVGCCITRTKAKRSKEAMRMQRMQQTQQAQQTQQGS